jgi:hypothetical protein
MKTKNRLRCAVLSLIGSLSLPVTSIANVVVVLDGYEYSNAANVVYRTDNQKVQNLDISGCNTNGNQAIPTPISATTLKTDDSVHIGLASVMYNLSQSRFYLTSELGDVICGGGIYKDTLFAGGFD